MTLSPKWSLAIGNDKWNEVDIKGIELLNGEQYFVNNQIMGHPQGFCNSIFPFSESGQMASVVSFVIRVSWGRDVIVPFHAISRIFFDEVINPPTDGEV